MKNKLLNRIKEVEEEIKNRGNSEANETIIAIKNKVKERRKKVIE